MQRRLKAAASSHARDVVETVIGPPDYVEQVLNERGLYNEARSRDSEHKH